MRAFPAAPCCVDTKDQLRALAPSAECPIAKENLARGLLHLGHAGKVGISCTRLVLCFLRVWRGLSGVSVKMAVGWAFAGRMPAAPPASCSACCYACVFPETLRSCSADLVGIPHCSPGLPCLRTHHVHSSVGPEVPLASPPLRALCFWVLLRPCRSCCRLIHTGPSVFCSSVSVTATRLPLSPLTVPHPCAPLAWPSLLLLPSPRACLAPQAPA